MHRRKTDISGDVGQAVMGNVNDSPRINNHNYINVTVSEGAVASTFMQDDAKHGRSHGLSNLAGMFAGSDPSEPPPRSSEEFDAQGLPSAPCVKLPAATPSLSVTICRDTQTSGACTRLFQKQLFVLVILLPVACYFLLFHSERDVSHKTAGTIDSMYCFYDGKTYSIGSAIDVAGVGVRICASASGTPYWKARHQALP